MIDDSPVIIDRLTQGDYAAAFKKIANLLLTRALLPRDFDELHRLTRSIEREGRILYRYGAPKTGFDSARVKADAPYRYVACFHEKVGRFSHIGNISLHAHGNYFRYAVRTAPVIINTAHIQSKYIDGTKNALDYSGDSFNSMVSTGIMLSKIAEAYLQALNCPRALIAIPVKDGIFLGTCERSDPDFLDKNRIMEGARLPARGVRGRSYEQLPVWRPKVAIVVRTYVHADKFREEDKPAFELFEGVLNHDAYDDVIASTMGNYVEGVALQPVKVTRAKRRAMAPGNFGKLELNTPPIRPETMHTEINFSRKEAAEYVQAASNGYQSFFESLQGVFASDQWLAYNQRKQIVLLAPAIG